MYKNVKSSLIADLIIQFAELIRHACVNTGVNFDYIVT